jgi:type I restriction enzyme, S subunit
MMPNLDRKSDWPMVSFGDVVSHIKDRVQDVMECGLQEYIRGGHFEPASLRLIGRSTLGDGKHGSAFCMRFRPGDVLYVSRNPQLRKTAVVDFEGICANTTYVCRAKEDHLLQDLLPFIMQTESFVEHTIRNKRGSTNFYLNWSDIAGYEFALPPLEEQRRIVEALLAFEHSLVSLGDACDSARLAHKSACIWLGDTLSKSPETQWTTIGELGDVRMGRQRSPKYQTGKHTTPYLRVANVFDGYIDTSDVLQMDFDERDYATYLLRDGDILLNEGQSRELVGRSAIFRGEVPDCCFQNTLIRFRSDVMVPEFAHTLFRHWLYTGVFAAASQQTTSIAHLGLKRFVQMKLPVLDREAQQELVTPVISVEAAFLKARERKNQCSKMKRSFLDKALSVGATTR